LLKIDNLHKKGASVVKNIFRKYLFGINQKEQYSYRGFKKIFLVGFSISSFIYKFFLYTGIILTVYFKFTKVLGIVLVILEVYVLIIRPMYNEVKAVMTIKKQMHKKNVYITSISIIVIIAILFAPLPWVISIPFEVISENSKIIYSLNDGFIKSFPAKNYSVVKKGELLMLQKNQLLNFDVEDRENELKILRTELDQISSNYELLGVIDVKLNQIKSAKEDVLENKRKIEQLKTKSPLDGTFVLFNEDDYKSGRWLNKGAAVGGVFDENSKIIYAYITSKDLGKINFNDSVSIYLNDSIASNTGKIISVNRFPVKVSEPSPLLSVAGGPLEVLKKVDESTHYYYLKQPYYILKIKPDDNSIPLGRTGYINIRKFSSIGFDFIRKVINVLQREMSF
jgi:putative peptide zinc metalloprotease protein